MPANTSTNYAKMESLDTFASSYSNLGTTIVTTVSFISQIFQKFYQNLLHLSNAAKKTKILVDFMLMLCKNFTFQNSYCSIPCYVNVVFFKKYLKYMAYKIFLECRYRRGKIWIMVRILNEKRKETLSITLISLQPFSS